MKKIMITMALVVLILSNVCGHSLMNALADETELPESQKYYTSIEIQKGDTQGAAECPLLTTSLN